VNKFKWLTCYHDTGGIVRGARGNEIRYFVPGKCGRTGIRNGRGGVSVVTSFCILAGGRQISGSVAGAPLQGMSFDCIIFFKYL